MPKKDENQEELPLENYYSLVELLEKLGKEGVAELVSKGKLQRMTRGDMIYFLKSDVNRILGEDILKGAESVGLIVDDQVPSNQFASQFVFKQSLLKRHDMGKEEEIYRDRVLDMKKEILYGRTHGDPKDMEAFKDSGIISSLHAKLYLDEDNNLLYENLGSNKSKIRGCKDKDYSVLNQNEIAVLVSREMLEELLEHPQIVTASVKIGFQQKPHFIVRIRVTKK